MPTPHAMTLTGFNPNAINPSAFSPGGAAAAVLGVLVSRVATTLPQTAAGALFTVAGGHVLVTSIVGEVTTVVQTLANNTKLVANPTVGTDVDLCAVNDITADAVGTRYGISGVLANAMQSGFAITGQSQGVVVPAGTIDLNCAASSTGAVRWLLRYVPLDEGATVVAA